MAIEVKMPRQGQFVETCILGEWYKQVGDHVDEGDLLFSYETDKASFEEEAKEEGVLLSIFYKEGEEVPVLDTVAIIGRKGENVDVYLPGSENSANPIEEEPRIDEVSQVKDVKDVLFAAKQDGRIKISPLARTLSKKLGIDYERILGSGPNGRIIARDIKAVAGTSSEMILPQSAERPDTENPAAAKKTSISNAPGLTNDFEVKKLSNVRSLIAGAMYNSLQNSAQLTHHMSADARKVLALRKTFKEKLGNGEISQNITINDLVCFAVIKALKSFPQLNTHFLGDSKRWYKNIHLGIAVDTERGLMVPVVRNAGDLSLEGLSVRINSLVHKCRQGNIDPELLSPQAGTFTVSNLGNYGVEMFTPIVNIPQSAILGVCAIVPQPRDLGEGVYGFIPMMGLSLSYDHQSIDGGEASLFLREIKKQIESIKYIL